MPSGARTPHSRRRWILRGGVAVLLVTWLATAAWQSAKPLPAGLHVTAAPVTVDAARLHFLADVTANDAFGQPVIMRQIFDATLALVADAKDLLVVDYFLFNAQRGVLDAAPDPRLVPLSALLRDALLARHRADPQLPILVLVDPINSGYGPVLAPELMALKDAGIDVVTVDLDPLRDSNALYSAAWRLTLRWWLTPTASGSWTNLLDAGSAPMSTGAMLRLLNFKADHRKLAVTGDGHGSLRGIVASANPHDASSAHSNVGIELAGPALLPLLDSEIAIARAAGWQGTLPLDRVRAAVSAPEAAPANASRVQVVTEGAIRDALIGHVDGAGRGDAIDIAMFYLSDRATVRALHDAAMRGVDLRIILDPNKDAFGHEKSGVPNRQVAAELVSTSHGAVHIRWYRTHGEQFHAKLVAVRHGERLWVTLGSANLTRRNLGDYNLEANVVVDLPQQSGFAQDEARWFDMLWANRAVGGVEYTADVDVYADPSQGRYWLYRFMEATGLSTF
jgi:phosphatidylserine/phosphatidylglycerophosphate/cardiolipin synthase-like enzyme